MNRVLSCFQCVSVVVVVKELHQEEGYHFHVGIKNNNARKKSAAKILRKAFPEFDGEQIQVIFHKAWSTICHHILKKDNEPLVWGEDSLKTIKKIILNQLKKIEKRILMKRSFKS